MSSPMAARCACIFYLAATAAPAQSTYLTYPTGIAPVGIVAADLNGDGLPDLAIANSVSNSLTILLNAKGAFTPLPPLSLAPAGTLFPREIFAADLNRDGKTDLIVTHPSSSGLSFGLVALLGNGDGTFQPPLPVPGCAQVTSLQIADLNADGIPDMAVTCLVGGFLIPVGANLSILLGKGDGTFTAGPNYSLGFTPWAVVTVADFNHDGTPDLAVAVGTGLVLFLNDGKAAFNAVVTGGEPWNFAPGIAAADFDGDGVLDLAVTSQSRANPARGVITILLGKGDGTFRSASSLDTPGYALLTARDLNGDGHPDLVEGLGALTLFAGRGDGSFQPGLPFGASGNNGYFALADFTGSGVLGFAGANASQTPDSVPLAGSVVILPSAAWPSPALALTSAAGFGLGPLAPGAIASALGVNLAPQTAQAGGTLPLSLGGANVTVTDSNGTARPAPLYYVSPAQVNYLIPPDTAAGSATVTIAAGNRVVSAGRVAIAPVAPSLFTVNAGNLAAATVVRFDANGNRTVEAIYQASPDGSITALPIDFGAPTDTVFVSLYGTGIRNLRTPGTLTATLASSVNARVSFVGPQGAFDGLDQVNIELPRSLASQSPHFTSLQLTADGQPSNLVTLFLQ